MDNITFAMKNIVIALSNNDNPSVLINIDKNGKVIYEGNLFGEGLWYPGKEKVGVIRINNNYNNIRINNIGLSAELKKVKEGSNKDEVYKLFLKHMKLTIMKGRLLIFSDKIFENKSFSELLDNKNSIDYGGVKLDVSDQFSISKRNSVDLKYILSMDNQAGEELESLKASVGFLIDFVDK